VFAHFLQVNLTRIEQLSQDGFTFVTVKVGREYLAHASDFMPTPNSRKG
jgi:hypothetical protein